MSGYRFFAVVLLAAAKAAAGTFTVATWNIGHLDMGLSPNSRIPTRDAEKWKTDYHAFLDPLDARIMMVEEYNPDFDKERTIRARDAIFGGYTHQFEGLGRNGHVNSLFLKDCVCGTNEIYAYSHRYQNTNFHFVRADIDGLETLVVATHLEPNWPTNHVAMRAQQMRELLEAVGDAPRVIIAGDLNIDSAAELKSFANAGFEMANDGSLSTWPSWKPQPNNGIDNVIVKGFSISNVRVLTNARLSDHCLLSCSLTPRDVSPVRNGRSPRFEPYLTGEEKVVWKGKRLNDVKALSATLHGRWITLPHVAKGVITERTDTSLTVQFQSLDGICKAVRARFRQVGADIVARVEKAGYADKSYYGKQMPDEVFKHEPATDADNGTYGAYRIAPSANCPVAW